MTGRTMTVLAVLAAAAIGYLVVNSADDPGAPVGEAMLPDLWTSAPFEIQAGIVDGRHVLRFTSEINNQGAGDLIIRGNPDSGVISQWIPHSSSGHSTERLDVDLVWGGDTHDHWHIDAVARYWIEPITGAADVERFDNKVGFCIFDSVDRLSGLPGAPDQVRYEIDGCGGRLVPDIAMGLSVGWGDQYRFHLAGQWIDIEDLPAGDYVLMAEVDPDGLLIESDRTNNTAFSLFTLEIAEDGARMVSEL